MRPAKIAKQSIYIEIYLKPPSFFCKKEVARLPINPPSKSDAEIKLLLKSFSHLFIYFIILYIVL